MSSAIAVAFLQKYRPQSAAAGAGTSAPVANVTSVAPCASEGQSGTLQQGASAAAPSEPSYPAVFQQWLRAYADAESLTELHEGGGGPPQQTNPQLLAMAIPMGCDGNAVAALRFANLHFLGGAMPFDWVQSSPASLEAMLRHPLYEGLAEELMSSPIEDETISGGGNTIAASSAGEGGAVGGRPKRYGEVTLGCCSSDDEDVHDSGASVGAHHTDPMPPPIGKGLLGSARPTKAQLRAFHSDWEQRCPVFAAYREYLMGGGGGGGGAPTGKSSVPTSAASMEAYSAPLAHVSHTLGTLQYAVIETSSSSSSSSSSGTAAGVTSDPTTASISVLLDNSVSPRLVYDAAFGLIGKPSEVKALWHRCVRVPMVLEQLRRRVARPLYAGVGNGGDGSISVCRLLLVCVGRTSGDVSQVVASIDGNAMRPRSLEDSVTVGTAAPTNAYTEGINTEALDASAPHAAHHATDKLRIMAGAIRTAVLAGRRIAATSSCAGASLLPTGSPRKVEVHVACFNVFDHSDGGSAKGNFETRMEHGATETHGAFTVVVNHRFVGFPSSARPWANVASMAGEWLRVTYTAGEQA